VISSEQNVASGKRSRKRLSTVRVCHSASGEFLVPIVNIVFLNPLPRKPNRINFAHESERTDPQASWAPRMWSNEVAISTNQEIYIRVDSSYSWAISFRVSWFILVAASPR
jgi:hypothetical protein